MVKPVIYLLFSYQTGYIINALKVFERTKNKKGVKHHDFLSRLIAFSENVDSKTSLKISKE
jgi:hypothetical protein